jgi:hypothetical protein
MGNKLFAPGDIEAWTARGDQLAGSISIPEFNSLGKPNSILEEVIKQVGPGASIHYMTSGKWSTHDLVAQLLLITGPADLYFSTFSLSEFVVRQLYELIERKMVRSIHALLDNRVKVGSLQFATNIFTTIGRAHCHAKVTVLKNERWGIAIVGSANYTNNPRIEAGVISADMAAADFHINWINNELNDGNSSS